LSSTRVRWRWLDDAEIIARGDLTMSSESRSLFERSATVFESVADKSASLFDRVRSNVVAKVSRGDASSSPDRGHGLHSASSAGMGSRESVAAGGGAAAVDTGPLALGRTMDVGRRRVVVERFLAEGKPGHGGARDMAQRLLGRLARRHFDSCGVLACIVDEE
jgi:hypothetical protein